MKIIGIIENIFLEGAQRQTAGDEPCEFTSRGEGGRVPPFIEELQNNLDNKSLSSLDFDKVLALISRYCGSMAAKEAIAQSFPSTCFETISKALDELDELMGALDSGLRFPPHGVREMRDILQILQNKVEILSCEELLCVRSNIEAGADLKKAFSDFPNVPNIAARLKTIHGFQAPLREITATINEKGELRDDASPRLQTLRRDLVKTRREIERKLTEFLNSGSEFFQDNFFTIRADRYVVPVKASSQNLLQGIVHDQSGSGQTIFIEPLEFLGLNNRIIRLQSEEREEIRRILRALTDLLASEQNELISLFETLVHFDILRAKSRFSQVFNACKPTISLDGKLLLKEARHPLLHPHCVPLTISLGDESYCIIITGPNSGGKTVALKTIGVSALLMQIGCFVLASKDSILPVFHEILSDIGESQCIESHLSTFTAHLKRLKEILSLCGEKSLVLIDEIGTGTDPIDGSALATGVLKTLVKRKTFTLATSHYEGLKKLAFTFRGIQNAGMEFDYVTLMPTFRLIIGVPGSSNAIAIARSFGMCKEVLEEMENNIAKNDEKNQQIFHLIEKERLNVENLRRTLAEKEKAVSTKLDEVSAEQKRLQAFRRSKFDELTESFERRLKAKMKQIENLIRDLKTRISLENPPNPNDLSLARENLSDIRNTISELEAFNQTETQHFENKEIQSFQVGNLVKWKTINQIGKIESINKCLFVCMVNFDGKILNLPLKELQKVDSDISFEKCENSSRPGMPACRVSQGGLKPPNFPSPSNSIRDAIDLRGLRVEEALEKTQNYLSQARSQQLEKVYLIHGKGTGALKNAIHQFLKRSSYKDQFRLGRYGEGDHGVTLVFFSPSSKN